MNKTPQEFYTNKKKTSEEELQKLKKKLTQNSILRLLSFILIFPSLFGLIQTSVILGVGCAVLFLAVFLLLVKKHLNLQKQKSYVSQVKTIAINELSALEHDFTVFADGEKYINHKHDYSYDLDIFGPGSIFQMINRTVTVEGESKLAKVLSEEPESVLQIIDVQESVKELAGNPDYSMHYRAIGLDSGIVSEDRKKLQEWIESKSVVRNNLTLKVLSYTLPVVLFATLGLAIYSSSNLGLFILAYFFNYGVIGKNFTKINKEQNQISGLLKMLQKYKGLLYVIESKEYQSEQLRSLKSKLGKNNHTSGCLLSRLTKHLGALDQRLNFLVNMFVEPFLLWDYHCLRRIDAWKLSYGELLPVWLDQVAEVDKLVSMSAHTFNNAGFTFPEFATDKVFETEQLGHPLISDKARVSNNFSLNKKGDYVIITGANMAGKSTFLRTVGVNMVMAKAGLPVCASKLEINPMRLYTSMRTSDSLAENESYFYAELLRLKHMLDRLEEGEELFIILDEILKGTNSVDKQKGSMLALEKILRLHGTGIIATHDLALTDIEKEYPDKVKNQCFEVEIDNAEINFDYKLYDGVTQKMNAMLLMEQMGIIS